MAEVKSCGFLIVRGDPISEFLLMQHDDRWDLPKGHVDPGETEMECALRELWEETGIKERDIEVVEGFRFTLDYPVFDQKRGGHLDKTLVIFLARLKQSVGIQTTEHIGFEWFGWSPPHRIQQRTIDPVLTAVEGFVARLT
jgi:bis(5'-nucleosidyl)-tetraphosphatase